MTREHRYSKRSTWIECAQGAAGFALTAGLLIAAQPAGPVALALAAGAVLFLVYFARAVVRHLTRIEVDERSIRTCGPMGAEIPWDEMRSLRLKHYTTRSDRSGGWMQLDVRAVRRAIRIDSNVSDFAGLAAVAGREALRRGRPLDESTRANLDALGVSLHD